MVLLKHCQLKSFNTCKMRLRGFQQDIKSNVYQQWHAGKRNVMAVCPTGGGKTVIAASIASEYKGAGCIVAHRAELLGQISLAYARHGIRHDIVAPTKVIKTIVDGHMDKLGRSFYDSRGEWKVASAQTLKNRDMGQWGKRVGLWIGDEGHHFLASNMWGIGVEQFTQAYGLLLTATPVRGDGKGLGRHHDGIADAMVEGPGMRWLINQGYLTDYRVKTPPSDLELDENDIGSGGDFNHDRMAAAVKKSHIVGDVVEHYKRHAMGKIGVTFAVDVEHGQTISNAFNAAGVKAAFLDSNSHETERRRVLKQLARGEILQVVNVDLFGEGFDLPAIQVVSMARPTASFGLYAQIWGRVLRLMIDDKYQDVWDDYTPEQRKAIIAGGDKPFGLILDHVGNFMRHKGPPDKPRVWSLDRRTKRAKNAPNDAIPMRTCLNITCQNPYERIYSCCPYCGTAAPAPAGRATPEQVDGDLIELSPETLARIRGEIARVDGVAWAPRGMDPLAAAGLTNRHLERQAAMYHLRQAIASWADRYGATGTLAGDSEQYRRFFLTFGIDVATAQTLGRPDAERLTEKVLSTLR